MNFSKYLDKIQLNSEHQLLLRASLLQGKEALEAWQQWQEAVDIEDHDSESYHLFPLLYRNLAAHQVDDAYTPRLKSVYRRQWYENQLLLSKLPAILASFQEAGIKTMLLNEVALAVAYYPEKGLRHLSSFDFLVPIDNVLDSIRLLEKLGFQPTSKLPENLISVAHALKLSNSAGQIVNLYWHVFWRCFQDDADREFWQGAKLIQVGDLSTYVLNPTDRLITLCVQAYPWHPVPPIRWLTDAIVISNSHSAEIDRDRLIHAARQYQLVLPATILFTKLSEFLNTPLANLISEKLRATRISEFERHEYEVITNNPIPILGSLSFKYFQYLRATQKANLRLKVLGFPKYLQYVWALEHLWQVPYHATLLGMKRLRSKH